MEPGQNNILIPWQVLWDQTTRDEYPRFELDWEETVVMTPAAPWESHSAMAHRKEKAGFLQIQDFLLPPSPLSCTAPCLTPLLACQGLKTTHGSVVWAASVPVPTRGLGHSCPVPSERGGLACAPQCHCCLVAPACKAAAGLGSPGMDRARLRETPQCGKFLKKQLPLNHIFI